MTGFGRFVGLLMVVGLMICVVTAADAANTNYVSSRSPLASTPYVPLPLGCIRARGWLLTQLQLQKTGLTGNAESVYDDLGPNSGWLGGTGSDWERPPYYLRGLLPLAYTLDDAALKTKAQKWMDWAINSAQTSGYFGPPGNTDWWGHMPMLIALEDYYEATNDARVLTLLGNYFTWQQNNVPDGLGYWGAARAADNILAVQWLYNRNGDPNLLTFMDTLRTLTEDWTTALTNGTFGDNHGVNVAEGFKMPPVWYLRSLSATDRNAFMLGITNGAKLHGQAHYALSCTEFMAGKSSLQGPELCSIVDRIFSDGVAMNIIGDPKIGDVTEKMAFNALPGCLSKTSRQHQYYDLPNQVQSLRGPKGIFGQDYENALCPSWFSGVGCCSLNWHQGWPKFAQYSWAATSANGLAIFTYAPTEVTALVGSGVSVKFTEDTNYPFEEQIRLTLTSSQSVAFPLEVRIPEWCTSPSVKVNGVTQSGVTTLTFYTINRTWANGDTVTLDFPMPLKATTQFNNSVAIEKGPLVFSLQIGENWVKRLDKTVNSLDFSEYEVKPTTNWNYGLIIDPADPGASITVNQRAMPSNPFVQSDTPITLTARAKLIPTWTMATNGLSNEVPVGPVATDAQEENVTLVPFGAENLRITYFPQVAAPGYAGGLTAQYYSDKTLTTLAMTRVDPSVNFDWGASSPGTGIGRDNFSVRWSGQVKPRTTGTYTFYVTSDDGRRLWVNGTQIINVWTNTSGTYTGTISLTAGTWYDIKLEYYENTLMANAKLEWSSSGQPREPIPPSCLRVVTSSGADVIYAFDETAGTIAKDSSGNDKDGTLTSGVTRALGKSGNAISLDADADYVSVPDLGNHTVLTAMAWVRLDSLGNSRNAVFHCNGWSAGDAALSIANTGQVVFSLAGASAEDQTSVYQFTSGDFGKWKHVTVVYDTAAKTAKFYIDGLPNVTRSYTTAPTAVLNGIRIGAWDGGGRNLRGKIDDFRVFSRALSDAEIAVLGSNPACVIMASAVSGGSISPSGVVLVSSGFDQTFTITPLGGYSIGNVLVDGVNVGPVTSYTFNNVIANHTISATFEPVAYYQFENNVNDVQGTYNGTAYGSPTYVAGKVGSYAIQFDGSSQYVSIARPVSTDFTIAFFVKTTQPSPTGTNWYNGKGMVDGEVVGVTNDFGISYINSKVAFGVGNPDTTFQSTSTINGGSWKHVACSRNSTTGQMKIYINGNPETTGTGPIGAKTAHADLHIGNLQTNVNYFSGAIDQLRIFDIVLSDADIAALAAESGTTYTITASAGGGGTITPSGAVVVSYGANQTFAIAANSSYAVSQMTVDGVNQGPITSYTFNNVTANHTISATFTAITTHTITASAGTGGAIAPSGVVVVSHGANQTFAIAANSGYRILQVTVDSVNQGAIASYTFNNVTANHTISATFSSSTLVAYYQFENNVNDTQGAFNGTAHNSPTYVTGKVGSYAIQFNGTNQYVSILRPVSTDWTIAFFVKTTQTSPTGSQWYNGKGLVDGEVGGVTNDFGVSYLNSKVAFGVGNTDTTFQSTSTINSGNWVHVACTRVSSTGEMKIYVNGTLQTTGTGPTGPKTAATYMAFGRRQSSDNYFSGAIDQLKIFNTVLTAPEVAGLAFEGTTCTITAAAGAGGSISPTGAVFVNYGAGQTFTITPNAGYGIVNMNVDGVSILPVSSYTFPNVTTNHTISAAFAKLIGMNNRDALTDSKVPGRVIKVWGKVKSIDGTTSFTIDDGYGIPITIRINGVTLPSGFGTGKIAVVTGVLNADKTVQAQDIKTP